jgi:hypothetical protein
MADLVIDASKVRLVEPRDPLTLIAGVDIDAGETCAPNATTGKWALVDSTFVGPVWVSINTVKAGRAMTAVYDGDVYLGAALDSLNFGAPVYLSTVAGKMADTGADLIGWVIPVYGNNINGTASKLLKVDRPRGG